jgi:hypothetical protein
MGVFQSGEAGIDADGAVSRLMEEIKVADQITRRGLALVIQPGDEVVRKVAQEVRIGAHLLLDGSHGLGQQPLIGADGNA